MANICITIIDLDNKTHMINTPLDESMNLMEVVKKAGFEMGTCGGMALCASCHCHVKTNNQLTSKTTEEEDMLDQLHNTDINQSRLICQIPIDKKLNGVILKMIKD